MLQYNIAVELSPMRAALGPESWKYSMSDSRMVRLAADWARATLAMATALALFVPVAWAQPAAPAVPDVVVTLKPVHALVAAVMDGVGSPHLLLDGAASPHTFAMKPSDVRRLNGAAVVVRVSAGLELFLTKPLAQAGRKVRVVTLDQIPAMTLLDLRVGGDFEPHQHGASGHGGSSKAAREHDHGHGHASTARAVDGHLWLDPANARVAALHIAEVLATVLPAEASRFGANARALAAKLGELDQRLGDELKPIAARPFIVFHDAYQYLERRYGLAAAGAVTVNPEVPPSAQRISQLRARLARQGVLCVFAEPQFPPRAIDAILEGTTVRRATLDPLGVSLAAGANHYFELMQGLARDLKGCLAPPA